MLRPLQWVSLIGSVAVVVSVVSVVRSIFPHRSHAHKVVSGLPRELESQLVKVLDETSFHVLDLAAVLDAEYSAIESQLQNTQSIDAVFIRMKEAEENRRNGKRRRAPPTAPTSPPPPTPPTPPPPTRKPRSREVPPVGDSHGQSTVAPLPSQLSLLKPIPILVIACNRVAVSQCLDKLIQHRWSAEQFPIIVSQDCGHTETDKIIERYVKDHGIEHYRQPNLTDPKQYLPKSERKWTGYYKIARHYQFALTTVFNHKDNFDSTIIIEDDLEIAPDFFEFFVMGRQLLRTDATLFCISAWNDNGKERHVLDPEKLYRSDFFGGLGWMITRDLWKNELEAKWTNRYWDDWMRLPEQRQHRACIRPEVSRTKTFGSKGVSKGQFYKKYLKFIQLNNHFVNFTTMDLSYLLKNNYDQKFLDTVYSLSTISAHQVNTVQDKSKSYRIEYNNNQHFKDIAKELGIMEDNKEGVFRMAYLGVVSIVWRDKGQHIDAPAVRLEIAPSSFIEYM